MKAVILAGGFAKRLYPLTLNKSKCLLEISGKPIIDYTIDKLKEIPEINEIIVISNDTFYNDFIKWKEGNCSSKIRILNDGGNSENSKIGAFTAFLNFLNKEEINENIFLAGADNFFKFSLKDIYELFKKENKDIAVFYDIKDYEQAKKFGVVVLGDKNIIKEFEEKPQNPKSTIVSACMYFLKKETLQLIKKLN
ncbi:MAG: nucleotidyltransferase family protein [Candidatus Pacearchaeota archaeon]|nr:nucleotidyltransferase family protein [Candidatus Pacearchaeota archaeon]